MMLRTLIGAALAVGVAACATPTPYGPMNGGYGYRDQRIEADRFRVAFNGNASTDRETVETFLLYRAAELTLENGFDHFLVVERDTDATRTYTASGYSPSVYGYYPYGYHRFPYYAYGYPWAYDTTIRERRRYEAHAFVLLRKGDKPESELGAYDARDVIENLSPAIQRSLQSR